MQRIRKAFDDSDDDHGPFNGPVEIDETYMGEKRKNMSNSEHRARADTGRGMAGMKDRGTN